MKKLDLLVVFLIIIVSCFILKDLFKPNFYTSHDGIHQVVRLYYFDQALRDGQVPPRWAGGLLNGFGYPLFIFSYHLPWLIAEPFYFLGFSIFASIKLTFLLGFIASGITMYLFLREVFGRWPAFVGMILYLFAPYRFSNIFVRAAIGDATCFIFLPLVFLSLYKLRKLAQINWRWVILGALSLAATLLSHAMVFFFLAISVSLYWLFWLIQQRRKAIFLLPFILLVLLSFGISSYYFIPSLVERNWTNFSTIMKSVYYGVSFLSLKKLFYSPWGYGTVDAPEGAMSLQIGIAQWLTVFLTAIFVIVKIFSIKLSKTDREFLKEATFFLLIFVLSIFIMLPPSSFLWERIIKVVFIDFTWRILPLTIFAVAYLAAYLISQAKLSWLVAVLLIGIALYGNRNHLRINQRLDWPVSFCLQLEETTNSYNEYTPKWVRQDLIRNKKTRIEFLEGKGKVSQIRSSSNYLEAIINTPTEGKIRINTIYYPGWVAWVNGKATTINYQNSGLIELPMGEGTSSITLKFKGTPLRLVSDLISLFSFGFISIILLKRRR